MSVNSPVNTLALATEAGARISESDIDGAGGNFCIIEGPSGLYFHISNHLKSSKSEDLIFSSSIFDEDRPETRERNDSITPPSPSPKVNRRMQNKRPAPIFRSLDVQILSNFSKNFIPCPPNSREPIQFETELFKGQALLVLRTNPFDPQFTSFFEGRRRMFEVQVQGKFKRMPQGEVFVGAESSNKMELGLITRGISKAVCNFCGTLVNDLHFSFGDNPKDQNYQVPHIVSPIFPTLDKVLITPPGEIPPPLGVPFVEDPAYRKERLKFRTIDLANIDLNTTYSFSVNTSNLDLPNWNLINIPMVRPMSMKTFFGDSSIALVSYEVPRSVLQASPGLHPVNSLNYLFKVKIASVDISKTGDIDIVSMTPEVYNASDVEDEGDDGDFDDSDIMRESGSAMPQPVKSEDGRQANFSSENPSNYAFAATESTLSDVDEDEGDEGDDEGDEFVQDEISVPDGDDDDNIDPKVRILPGSVKSIMRKKKRFSVTEGGESVRNSVGQWFKRRIDGITPETDIPETAEYANIDLEMESFGDLRFCPMIMEINEQRLLLTEGRKRTMFLLPFSDSNNSSTMNSSASRESNLTVRFRSYTEITKIFPLVPIPKFHRNKKMALDEKKRRQIVESYKSFLSKGQVSSSLSIASDIDKKFLNDSQAQMRRPGKKSSPDTWEGAAAIALGPRHWSEYYFKISVTDVSIGRTADSKRPTMVIVASSILRIRRLPQEESPLPFVSGFAFIQIETVARVFYLMIRDSQYSQWIAAFTLCYGPSIVDDDAEMATALSSMDSLEPYLAKPPSWKFDKKRIFNYRRIIFNPNGIPAALRNFSNFELVEALLTKVFALAVNEVNRTADAGQWMLFLDAISVLQIINFYDLNEAERAAVMLNLYHLMVVHASLILGPPVSRASMQSFSFNTAYIVNFDMISIVEIEHNILRDAMSRPSQLLSKISVPNSSYPGLALTRRDFRLNFCINIGSRVMLESVPIYRAETLDRQMDDMTIKFLSEFVMIDSNKRLITLPKICAWFPADFSLKRSSSATPVECLRVLAPYLRGENRSALSRMLADGNSPSVKFRSFQYRCRLLALQKADTRNSLGLKISEQKDTEK